VGSAQERRRTGYEACRPVGGWAGGWLHPAGRQAPDQVRLVSEPKRWEPQRSSMRSAEPMLSRSPVTPVAAVLTAATLWIPRMRCTFSLQSRPSRSASETNESYTSQASARFGEVRISCAAGGDIRYDPLADRDAWIGRTVRCGVRPPSDAQTFVAWTGGCAFVLSGSSGWSDASPAGAPGPLVDVRETANSVAPLPCLG
jgi:hypothetical protein